MTKLAVLIAVALAVGTALAPHVGAVLYWTMAFLSVLMAGSLLRGEARKLAGRLRGHGPRG